MMRMAGIFKAYDIRGRYPDELGEEMAEDRERVRPPPRAKRIVVGRDMRLSSASIAGAFAQGVTGPGRTSPMPVR